MARKKAAKKKAKKKSGKSSKSSSDDGAPAEAPQPEESSVQPPPSGSIPPPKRIPPPPRRRATPPLSRPPGVQDDGDTVTVESVAAEAQAVGAQGAQADDGGAQAAAPPAAPLQPQPDSQPPAASDDEAKAQHADFLFGDAPKKAAAEGSKEPESILVVKLRGQVMSLETRLSERDVALQDARTQMAALTANLTAKEQECDALEASNKEFEEANNELADTHEKLYKPLPGDGKEVFEDFERFIEGLKSKGSRGKYVIMDFSLGYDEFEVIETDNVTGGEIRTPVRRIKIADMDCGYSSLVSVQVARENVSAIETEIARINSHNSQVDVATEEVKKSKGLKKETVPPELFIARAKLKRQLNGVETKTVIESRLLGRGKSLLDVAGIDPDKVDSIVNVLKRAFEYGTLQGRRDHKAVILKRLKDMGAEIKGGKPVFSQAKLDELVELIPTMQNELEEYKGQIENFQGLMQKDTSAYTELEQKNHELKNNLNSTAKALAEREQTVAQLQKQVRALEDGAWKKEQSIRAEERAEAQKIRVQLDKARAQLVAAEKGQASLDETRQAQQAALAETQAELDALREGMIAAEKEYAVKEADLMERINNELAQRQEKEAEAAKLAGELESSKSEVERAKSDYSRLEQVTAAKEARLAEVSGELENSREKAAGLEAALVKSKADAEKGAKEAKAEGKEEGSASREPEITILKEQLESLQKRIEATQSAASDDAKAARDDGVEEGKAKAKAELKPTITRLEAEVEGLKSDSQQKDSKIGDLETRLEESKGLFERLQETKDELQKDYDKLQADIEAQVKKMRAGTHENYISITLYNELKRELDTVKAQLEETADNAIEINRKYEGLEEEHEKSKEKIVELDTRVKGLKEAYEEAAQEVENLMERQNDYDAAKQELAEKTSALEENERNLAEASQSVAQLEERLAARSDELSEASAKIKETEAVVESLKESLSNSEHKKEENYQEALKKSEELEAAAARIAELEGDLGPLATNYKDALEKAQTLEVQRKELAEKKGELEAKVAEYETNLNHTKEELEAANEQAAELEKNLQDKTAEYEAEKKKSEELDAKVKELDAQSKENAEKAEGLDKELGELKKKYEGAEAEIAKLKSSLADEDTAKSSLGVTSTSDLSNLMAAVGAEPDDDGNYGKDDVAKAKAANDGAVPGDEFAGNLGIDPGKIPEYVKKGFVVVIKRPGQPDRYYAPNSELLDMIIQQEKAIKDAEDKNAGLQKDKDELQKEKDELTSKKEGLEADLQKEQEDRRMEVAKLRADHDEALTTLTQSHSEEVGSLHESYGKQILELKDSHKEELEGLKTTYEAQITELGVEHDAEKQKISRKVDLVKTTLSGAPAPIQSEAEAHALYTVAQEARQNKKYGLAVELLGEVNASRKFPHDHLLYFELGTVQLLRGDEKSAEQTFNHVLSLNPPESVKAAAVKNLRYLSQAVEAKSFLGRLGSLVGRRQRNGSTAEVDVLNPSDDASSVSYKTLRFSFK